MYKAQQASVVAKASLVVKAYKEYKVHKDHRALLGPLVFRVRKASVDHKVQDLLVQLAIKEAKVILEVAAAASLVVLVLATLVAGVSRENLEHWVQLVRKALQVLLDPPEMVILVQ